MKPSATSLRQSATSSRAPGRRTPPRGAAWRPGLNHASCSGLWKMARSRAGVGGERPLLGAPVAAGRHDPRDPAGARRRLDEAAVDRERRTAAGRRSPPAPRTTTDVSPEPRARRQGPATSPRGRGGRRRGTARRCRSARTRRAGRRAARPRARDPRARRRRRCPGRPRRARRVRPRRGAARPRGSRRRRLRRRRRDPPPSRWSPHPR